MHVQIAYALSDHQVIVDVDLPPGTSVGDAVRASGLLERFLDISLDSAALGIFGERVALDDVLEEGDRVEIYRPLLADPKEARRRRARRR